MPSLNCASINFGGINTSKLEFADFSNPEVKAFFQKIQNDFNSIKQRDLFRGVSIRAFIQDYFKEPISKKGIDSGVLAFTNYMLDTATRFMVENMNQDFLLEMAREEKPSITPASLRSEFDLGEVKVCGFVNHILVKDKGIGGFDQISSGRPTNIGANLNAFLIQDGETGEWVFNQNLSIKSTILHRDIHQSILAQLTIQMF